jgi:hypothetical protein
MGGIAVYQRFAKGFFDRRVVTRNRAVKVDPCLMLAVV